MPCRRSGGVLRRLLDPPSGLHAPGPHLARELGPRPGALGFPAPGATVAAGPGREGAYWAGLIAALAAEGAQVLDPSDVLLAAGALRHGACWMTGGHYSAKGNRVVARAVQAAWLAEQPALGNRRRSPAFSIRCTAQGPGVPGGKRFGFGVRPGPASIYSRRSERRRIGAGRTNRCRGARRSGDVETWKMAIRSIHRNKTNTT